MNCFPPFDIFKSILPRFACRKLHKNYIAKNKEEESKVQKHEKGINYV